MIVEVMEKLGVELFNLIQVEMGRSTPESRELEAFRQGAEQVSTLSYANSNISGINVPFSGDHALAAVRESGGMAAGVSDEAVLVMQRRLAVDEGLWVEPASAAPLAALADLCAQGQVQADTRIVCVLSGAGFKDTHLAAAETQLIDRQEAVAFDVKAIVEQVV